MLLRRMKLYIKLMYVMTIIFIVGTLVSIYRSDWLWFFLAFFGFVSTLYGVKQMKEAHDMLKEAIDNVSDEKPI